MSLHGIKCLYCLLHIAVALVLVAIGGLIGWITAVVLLSGALPLFATIRRAAEHRGVSDYRRLRQSAAHRILSAAQAELDVREVGK